jgi:hypothetical protein
MVSRAFRRFKRETEKFILFYENEGRLMKLRYFDQDAEALGAVRTVLEAAGVQLIEENGCGAGVCLLRSAP